MSQEVLPLRVSQVALILDLKSKDFHGQLILESDSGQIPCPITVEAAQSLMEMITSGHQSPSSSTPRSTSSPQSEEELEADLSPAYEPEAESEEGYDPYDEIERQLAQHGGGSLTGEQVDVSSFEDDSEEEPVPVP